MKPLPSTQSFHALDLAQKDNWRKIKRLALVTFIVGVMFFFSVGFSLCYFYFPREKIVEKTTIVEVEIKTAETFLEAKVEERMNKELLEMMGIWNGVLEVKDGQAQTVRYKRAAIAKKGGFMDLENNKPYPIFGYLNHENTGYGIIRCEDKTLFLLKWNSGKTKAPIINPGAIVIPQGIIVQTTGQ